jgi:hypothetical protein
MVNVLLSSVINPSFKPLLGQTNDYKFGIYCFSAKHEVKEQRLVGLEAGQCGFRRLTYLSGILYHT